MKKITLTLITLTFLLTGCYSKNYVAVERIPSTLYRNKNCNWQYRVIVIDRCQYIEYDRSIAHKGNCTNTIHIYNKD